MNRFITLNIAAVGCFCFTGLTSTLWAADWPQWRGPARDGISKESGWQSTWPAEGPHKLWERKVGAGYSSMSVSAGRVYTLGNAEDVDSVWCFDAASGEVSWHHDYPCPAKDPNGFPGPRCTPTVDGDRVYTVSRHGHLLCLDSKTGAVKWSKNLVDDFGGKEPRHGANGENEGWGYSGSPLVEKDLLLVEAGGTAGSSVIALKKKTGELVWKNGNDVAGYGSLMPIDIEGQRCFLQFAADHFIGRKMADGSELWRVPWKTSYGVNAATPVIQKDEVFISSGYGFACALLKVSLTKAEEVWRNKSMKNQLNSCVLLDGCLYGYDENELRCVDWKTGEVKWGEKGYGKGSLMYAGGKLVLFGQGGKLGIAEPTPAAFKEISCFQALQGQNTWAAPVLADGRIFVRNLDILAAFDVHK